MFSSYRGDPGGSEPLGGFGLGVKGGCWRSSEVLRRAHPQPLPQAGGEHQRNQSPSRLREGSGVGAEPPTLRMAMNRRRSRRKADRPPRLMARKPSGPDGPRPALEGENKRLAGPVRLRSSPRRRVGFGLPLATTRAIGDLSGCTGIPTLTQQRIFNHISQIIRGRK